MNKICLKCNTYKDNDEFYSLRRNKDGLDKWCKSCRNIDNKRYREENKERVIEARKKLYQENIEKMRAEKREYCSKHREEKKLYDVEYRKLKAEKIKKQKSDWEKSKRNDPVFKIKRNVRRRLGHILDGNLKPDNTFKLIGCSAEELKVHLEKQFLPGMTWDNYGKVWHIDHIVMLQEFNVLDEKELRLAFHFTNLRPLWASDNVSKRFNLPRQTEQTSTHR